MYAVTSMPLVRRTRATLRSAEFGFFGVLVYTRVQTPRRWGAPFSAGVLVLVVFDWRPLRTSCWIVGTEGRGYSSSAPPSTRSVPTPSAAGRPAQPLNEWFPPRPPECAVLSVFGQWPAWVIAVIARRIVRTGRPPTALCVNRWRGPGRGG